MKWLMMPPTRDSGRRQRLGDGTHALSLDPAKHGNQTVRVAGLGERRRQDFHSAQGRAKKDRHRGTHTHTEKKVAKIGTQKHPAVLRTDSPGRAHQLLELCDNHGIVAIVGVEPGLPEDISDLERALNPPSPVRAGEKTGRNELCPCGSGRKTKKCCPELCC